THPAKVNLTEKDRTEYKNTARWLKQQIAQLEVPYYDVSSMRSQLRDALAVAHAELGKKLSGDLDTGSLKKSADKLTAARMKLAAFMTLGWNESMRHDPVLLSLFRDTHGIPTKNDIMEAYRQLPLPRQQLTQLRKEYARKLELTEEQAGNFDNTIESHLNNYDRTKISAISKAKQFTEKQW